MTRIISALEKMEQVEADKKIYRDNGQMGLIQRGSSILA